MEKTIMGYTAEEIRGQAIAFRCETEEFAKDLVEKLYGIGVKWPNAAGPETTMWGEYQEETCYGIYDNKKFQRGDFFRYDKPNEWEKRGYKIIGYRIELEQRTYKAWELEEGIVYEIKDVGFAEWLKEGERVIFDGANIYLNNETLEVLTDKLSFFGLKNLEFIETEWEPRIDELFYWPSFMDEHGYAKGFWDDEVVCNRIKNTVGVYRTRKEAVEKAKELGWY